MHSKKDWFNFAKEHIMAIYDQIHVNNVSGTRN